MHDMILSMDKSMKIKLGSWGGCVIERGEEVR